jgi:hypothetical protein
MQCKLNLSLIEAKMICKQPGVKDDRIENNVAVHAKCVAGYRRDYVPAGADEPEGAGELAVGAGEQFDG